MYNFTERVRAILIRAREEATRLHHDYVGTEHLLLALSADRQGVAAAVLTNAAIDPNDLRNSILALIKAGAGPPPRQLDLPYTARGKKVLEYALTEARELGHSFVGAEHLLLGLLRESKGLAAQALTNSGLTHEAARAETQRLVGFIPPAPLQRERPEAVRRVANPTRALSISIAALVVALLALAVALLK